MAAEMETQNMSKLSMNRASRGTIHIYSQHRQAAGWTATKAIGMRWKAEKSLLGLEHVADQVNDTVAVAPLVVVPRDKLDEVIIQGDTSLGIEDARPVETAK